MEATSIIIPKEYGYVILAAASTSILSIYHGYVTGTARGAAKIPYPNPYAPTMALPPASASSKTPSAALAQQKAEYKMNCAQRAHAHFQEQLPVFLPALMLSGLRWPLLSSALGAAWVVSRVLYVWGYVYSTAEKGAGRYWGIGHLIAQLGLVGMTVKMGWDLVF